MGGSSGSATVGATSNLLPLNSTANVPSSTT